MRKVMCVVVLMLSVSGNVRADEDWKNVCGQAVSIAGTVMQQRQNGAAMQSLMESMGKSNKLIEQMIISAYERPRLTVKESQNLAITDFKDGIYLECVKSAKR